MHGISEGTRISNEIVFELMEEMQVIKYIISNMDLILFMNPI